MVKILADLADCSRNAKILTAKIGYTWGVSGAAPGALAPPSALNFKISHCIKVHCGYKCIIIVITTNLAAANIPFKGSLGCCH